MIVLFFLSEEPKPKWKFSCKSLEDRDSQFFPIIQKKPTDLREKQHQHNKTKTKKKPTDLREKAAPTQPNENNAQKQQQNKKKLTDLREKAAPTASPSAKL